MGVLLSMRNSTKFHTMAVSHLLAPLHRRLITAQLAAWLVGGLLCYFPNNGGSGLMLPHNILAWWCCGALAISTALWCRSWRFIPAVKSRMLLLMPGGAALWSLPLLWAPTGVAFVEGAWHVVALWGLLVLLWLMRLLPARRERICSVLTIIWFAALAQSIFGFLQVTVLAHYGGFSGQRPVGIFQQVNLLASFLSTGFACLLLRGYLRPAGSRALRTTACASLVFIPFMLELLQSRAGALGAMSSAVLVTCLALRSGYPRRRILGSWLLVLSGILLALAWQHGLVDRFFPDTEHLSLPASFALRDTTGSTHERWHIILNTWQMILEHPWLGCGYGGFEAAFADTAIRHSGAVVNVTLIHPHNEILYAWAEGGLVALAGLAMMISGVLVALWQRGGMRWGGLALLLPIAIHMNLEYPLYQSVVHGVVVVLLLSVALPPAQARTSVVRPCAMAQGRLVRTLTLAAGLSLMAVMVSAFHTQQALTRAERQNISAAAMDSALAASSPVDQLIFSTRIGYDQHLAMLLRYNQIPDPQLLFEFSRWADGFLRQHNDPNVMADRLAIGMVLTPDSMSAVCLRAHQLWPHDRRMRCLPAEGSS